MRRHHDVNQLIADVRSRDKQSIKLRLSIRPELLSMRSDDVWGYTALHWAAMMNGDSGVIKLLLDNGADINVEAKRIPWRASSIAARHGNLGALKILIDAGENINIQMKLDLNTALHCKQLFTLVDQQRCM